MIAVNGDENVDLENTQLYNKASRLIVACYRTNKKLHSKCDSVTCHANCSSFSKQL